MDNYVPLLVLLLLLGDDGGDGDDQADDDQIDDQGGGQGGDDLPADDEDSCGPGGAYTWFGMLAMPSGGANAYGLSPAEYSAAATVLTRVENQVYKPDFETGTQSLCNRLRVQKAAGTTLDDAGALAMLTYWKVRNAALDPGEKLPPHPTVDPALSGVTMELMRAQWVALYTKLRGFFLAGIKAGDDAA